MNEESPRQVNRAISMLRALARAERLQLLAAIGSEPVGIGVLSDRTGVPIKALAKELARLEAAGLLRIDKGSITTTPESMADVAAHLERALPITQIVERRGLERFFKDGLLIAIPVDVSTQDSVASALIELVPKDVTLTEPEVNAILGAVFADHATLRRLLVDFGYLERGAGVDYRRVR